MVREPSPGTVRRIFGSASNMIKSSLPDTWEIRSAGSDDRGGVVQMVAPDGTLGEITIRVYDRLTPREAAGLSGPTRPTIIAASWLSPRTRELLTEGGYGYFDETGNTSVALDRPALVIRTQGAARDPAPRPSARPNLRGPRAWALLRTLAEVQPPYGVRDLSKALDTDAGYVSRLLRTLDDYRLIDRKRRGPVRRVEWESTLRQMATTYSLTKSNEPSRWISPSGPEQFLVNLANSEEREWAVTGSFVACNLVSVTAPTIAMVYTRDPERIAEVTRLRSIHTFPNVILLRPYSPIVFERLWGRPTTTVLTRAETVSKRVPGESSDVYDTVRGNASLAQVVVDCLTGPGRMPSEAEALLDWMRYNHPRWQAPALDIRSDIP